MDAVIKVYWDVNPYEIVTEIKETSDNVFIIPLGAMITNPSATGGGIQSVNGKTGANIVLNANDVGAEPTGSISSLRTELNSKIDIKADTSYVNAADSAILGQVNLKASKTYVDQQDALLQDALDLKADAQAVNQALGTKADLVNGVIPANQLPSFVDDVLEYANLASFPAVGEAGKIYIALDVNKTYRWSGSTYVEIGGGGVALGETATTAYRGDRGKTAYDHSQSQGNPHNTTTSEIPEGSKLFFTELRVRSTPLTGLSIPSTATPITATDTLIQALGKIQGSLNNPSGGSDAVWVDSKTIGTWDSTMYTDSFTRLEFARWQGCIWVRGWMFLKNISSAVYPFEVTNPKYKIINPLNGNTEHAWIEALYSGNATSAATQMVSVFSSGVINNATTAASVQQRIRGVVSVPAGGQMMYVRPQALGLIADPT